MQISQEKIEGLKQQFKVVVAAQDFQNKVTERLQQLGQKVRLDGFRPGKAPLSILTQRYGAQATEETLNNTVHSSLHKITKDFSLRQATQPQVSIESLEEGKDLEIKIDLEVLPEITVKDFKDISLEKIAVEITDAEVEERLTELCANHKKFAEPEKARAAKENDRLQLSISATVAGKPFKQLGEQLQVELGEHPLLSGKLEEALKGAKVGADLTVVDQFPDDFADKNLAGKEISFQIKVNKIEQLVKVELNDDLAKDFNCENVDEMRQKIRQTLETEYGNLARLRLKRHLLDNLAQAYSFELPPSMVEGEFNMIWQRLQTELAQAKEAGTLTDDDNRPEEELRSEYQSIAERRVRLGLLISEIARLNKIKVDDEELRRAIFSEAMRYPQQMKQVFEFYQKNPAALEQIAAPILEDKVVDFILSAASLTERKVDVPGLMKAVRGVVPGFEEDDSENVSESKEKKSAKEKSTKSKGKAA